MKKEDLAKTTEDLAKMLGISLEEAWDRATPEAKKLFTFEQICEVLDQVNHSSAKANGLEAGGG